MIPKIIEILDERSTACQTLIDYILDDVPHTDQQPLLDSLRSLQGKFNDERDDAWEETKN